MTLDVAQNGWTDEAVDLLIGLWGGGVPTSEIGRQLGTTKNAVVGKAARTGLPPRPSPIHAAGPPRPRVLRRPVRTLPALSERPIELAPPRILPDPGDGCRWVTGERPWTHCCAPIVRKLVCIDGVGVEVPTDWCEAHRARVYVRRAA